MRFTILFYFILFYFGSIITALAGEEQYTSRIQGTSIKVNKNSFVEDVWHRYMKNNPNDWYTVDKSAPQWTAYDLTKEFVNLNTAGYVSLRWEGNAEEHYNEAWEYRVEVEIQSWDAADNVLPTITRELRIDHTNDNEYQAAFKDWDIYHIPNANRLKTTVTKVEYYVNGSLLTSSANGQIVDVKSDIYLESTIKIDRVYLLDVTENFQVISNGGVNTTDRTITYSWQAIDGAIEYDFEWLVISSDLDPAYTPDDLIDWERATRVSLYQNHYTIELPYDESRVYFRVRAVGYGNVLEHRLTTDWVEATPITISDVGGNITPLEQEKNWSYSATYAEEGKRVEVLNFADGTGRGRQSITKDNSYNRSIVSETVFDKEGRQAIQVIPSVAPSSQIRFFNNYNLAESTNSQGQPTTAPVNWTHFDLDQNYTAGNHLSLSTASGSSQYFSPNNAEAGSHIAAYIPDAEKIPYTQTILDNQGRVKVQTGIGENYRLGSGHETRYAYAAAFQEDLDELFGSEIGYADHYSMQLVTDANGQSSISYTNLSGKTVATGIVGQAPVENGQDLVEELDGSVYNYPTSRVKSRNLAAMNALEEGEDGSLLWAVRKEFMVTSAGAYEFNYSMTPGTYLDCATGLDETCEFELKINIYDDEGNLLNNSLNTSNGNFIYGEYNPIPTTGNFVLDFTFNAGLADVGAYLIEKELRLVNTSDKVAAFTTAILAYKENYEDYIEQLYTAYQYNIENPDETPLVLPTAPTSPYSNCIDFANFLPPLTEVIEPCEDNDASGTGTNVGYCSILQELLAQDLLPGGQYYEDPNWLDNAFPVSSTNKLSYDGVDYNSWAEIRALNPNEIEEIMELYNIYSLHPEWCLYAFRCEGIQSAANGGRTWYEEMLYQDAEWMNMDEGTASNLGYLNLPPGGVFCDPATDPNDVNQYGRNEYGNDQYSMLSAITNRLSTYPAVSTNQLTDLKYNMCQYLDNNGSYDHIATLAQLHINPNTPPTVTNGTKWNAIRPLMID